jgi:hypothetical protein
VLDQLLALIQRIPGPQRKISPKPTASFIRVSFIVASLFAAVLVGSLFLREPEGSLQIAPLPTTSTPTDLLPATGEVALTICGPENQTASCSPGGLAPEEDLANAGNDIAQPAVSKDSRPSQDGNAKAAYVNDGHAGGSWVSGSPDSWIKIDLGQVRTINTVSLQKGNTGSASDNHPGQFVISVALSDVYADGNSRDDYAEYSLVFRSEQVDFSGTVSDTATLRIQFPAVRARLVKITFEQAGAAIEEVGVFMVQPPDVARQVTSTPHVSVPGSTLTAANTDTALAMDTATFAATSTGLPANTTVPTLTNTPPRCQRTHFLRRPP